MLTAREDMPYIHTFWHKKYRAGWPLTEDVCIEDIAWSLAHLCRFTGHVSKFYSVAEHSVRVSYLCPEQHQLWGLLHDATESFIGDMNRPLKYSPGLEAYRDYEDRNCRVIMSFFGLGPDEPKEVKDADNRLLVTEQRDLMWGYTSGGNTQKVALAEPSLNSTLARIEPLPEVIDPWTPEEARRVFLMRFYELFGQREFYMAPEERNRRESFRLSDIARTVDQVTATGSPKEDRRKPKEN